MPARSAITRRRRAAAADDTRAAAAAAPLPGSDGSQATRATDGFQSRTDTPSAPDTDVSRRGKAPGGKGAKAGKGGKKAAIAALDATVADLAATVADLDARLDALTRVVDEAIRASIAERPKASEIVRRPRAPKQT